LAVPAAQATDDCALARVETEKIVCGDLIASG
jgi:hypothetical protein